MTSDTGGSAFSSGVDAPGVLIFGMTLLDWFAGQALGDQNVWDCTQPYESLAKDSYAIAAAMIAEKRRREADNVANEG